MSNQAADIAIIGAGPAGLMAAETLLAHGLKVSLYDAMPSPARKFLMAGKSGLNITHDEPLAMLTPHYHPQEPMLLEAVEQFGPAEIVAWMAGLGIESFIGSSGHIFPLGMKASPLLRAWLRRLAAQGATFHPRHQWTGWTDAGALRFAAPQGEVQLRPSATLLALGGASWPRLGSTGTWSAILAARGVDLAPFRPANCGFIVNWSEIFRERFAGHPVKSVALRAEGAWRRGEFVVSAKGIEGSGIYPLSRDLREQLEAKGSAQLTIDLAPGRTVETLRTALSRPRGKQSLATHLKRVASIDGVKAGLLREVVPPALLSDPARLAAAIKALPLPLSATYPIEGAISTAGGVRFSALRPDWMLAALPGVFCAGEMLDWEAPTGGYLLTACLATGRAAALGLRDWLSGTVDR